MAWVCRARVLSPFAPEPDRQAASVKQDKVGKMEQIAAIIVSKLFPRLFTQFCPLEVSRPNSFPPSQKR